MGRIFYAFILILLPVFLPAGTVVDAKWIAASGVVFIAGDKEPVENITIYPNPTAGELRLTFALENPGSVTVEIIDIAGKVCYSNASPNASGQLTYQIDLSGHPAGYYMLTIRTTDGVVVKRLTKI